ncbi:MAG TPA: acetyl-CoA carboxylase biotin carboxylase subunit [bacterium]|nr:acetyl-CoA carboxylase biotin carboxylase subunit [Candidatus Omnitrophota bacterium]HOJ60943.1 acetyl-CoA carboxylase biotin carboxylase subunit [bacterium]HOL93092.1 acetyl-CoA carboxylase biotin carboxylase subunit [bacterium]HPO99159.1 acetyl-CoA carboxylase biotin carboxylase subunit [bacterium]
MFKKILIANRGEIALRIIRACRELGISTVAVYSEADRDALHVRFADEIVCIGPPPPAESYLNIPRILSAAEITDAEAIHPGYGFLAENPAFAEICGSCNIVFIGPSPKSIAMMGDKSMARAAMRQEQIPTVPGSDGIIENAEEAVFMARKIGYPVMIKAAAGGGGRGMRVAHTDVSLVQAFITAQAEAEKAFGDQRLYLEKLILEPRHVEIQILADQQGNILHLGERDCSLQRRHQKVVEESPCPIMDDDLRRAMGETAIRCARAAGYYSAGTVEFLLDQDRRFYFMEMNTRVQVEHPVTEMVTGVDVIKEQIRIAAGLPLTLTQDAIEMRGHAIECRINAEDPYNQFMPSPGKITGFHMPGGPGIRVDSHAYSEYVVPPYYDSLLAKLIAYGRDRCEAIAKMRRALDEFVVEGISTTIPLLQLIMEDSSFLQGKVHTSHLDSLQKRLDMEHA